MKREVELMKYAIFPLNIFVLPGEHTYLHIFEPRYQELLADVEETNMPFGIYYESSENTLSYGTMVTLTEVIKRYPGGELDIEIQGEYIFRIDNYFQTLGKKGYAGGVVSRIDLKDNILLDAQSLTEMADYVRLRDEDQLVEIPSRIWDAAIDLGLTSQDKYAIAKISMQENQLSLLRSYIQLQKAIVLQTKQQKFNTHLN